MPVCLSDGWFWSNKTGEFFTSYGAKGKNFFVKTEFFVKIFRASMSGEPNKRQGFRFSNPRGFRISVGVRIIGMEVPCATLFDLVGAGRFRMRAQIISKREVTFGLRRICLEKVKLNHAYAALVAKGAIASFRYAILAMPIVAERLNPPTFPIQVSQIGDHGHQVDDRLRSQSRHRRGTDMMDRDQNRTKHPQTFSMARRDLRPIGIIRSQYDWNWLWHGYIYYERPKGISNRYMTKPIRSSKLKLVPPNRSDAVLAWEIRILINHSPFGIRNLSFSPLHPLDHQASCSQRLRYVSHCLTQM